MEAMARYELDVISGNRLLCNMAEVVIPPALAPEVAKFDPGTMLECQCTRDASGTLRLERIDIRTLAPSDLGRRVAWYLRRNVIPLAAALLDDAAVADVALRATRALLRAKAGEVTALEDLDVLLGLDPLEVPANADNGLWEIARALARANVPLTPPRALLLERAFARQLEADPEVTRHPRFTAWVDYRLQRLILDAAPEQRPQAPFHLGGGAIDVGAAGERALAQWCAEQVRPWDTKNQAEYGEILETLARHRAQPSDDTHARLTEFAERPRRADNAISVARLAASAEVCRDDLPGGPFSAALTRAGMLVKKPPKGSSGPAITEREFLTGLDRELVRWDFRRAVKEHAGVEITDGQVLYRPSAPGDLEGRVALWLVRTPRGLGLLAKLAGAWQWLEGEKETVLATVPAEYFSGAVSAAS
jgi:hypothetical protein